MSESGIRRLDDEGGQFVITIICGKCNHVRETYPEALARIAGWSTSLEELRERMRCSACQARGACRFNTERLKKPLRDPKHP